MEESLMLCVCSKTGRIALCKVVKVCCHSFCSLYLKLSLWPAWIILWADTLVSKCIYCVFKEAQIVTQCCNWFFTTLSSPVSAPLSSFISSLLLSVVCYSWLSLALQWSLCVYVCASMCEWGHHQCACVNYAHHVSVLDEWLATH